jgi:hypothetical protein
MVTMVDGRRSVGGLESHLRFAVLSSSSRRYVTYGTGSILHVIFVTGPE